jgi:electron transfer flavoprotein beta subunit
MRYKRARVEAELAADVKAAMADATEEERTAELAKRVDDFQTRGLLMDQWSLDDVGADLQRCGLSGSPTKVYKVQAIVLTKEGYSEVPPTEEGIHQLIHELVVDRTLG